MGLSIKWDITYKCNLMCDHCINDNYFNNEENECFPCHLGLDPNVPSEMKQCQLFMNNLLQVGCTENE